MVAFHIIIGDKISTDDGHICYKFLFVYSIDLG
jgi:hypothetical protein